MGLKLAGWPEVGFPARGRNFNNFFFFLTKINTAGAVGPKCGCNSSPETPSLLPTS